MFTTEIQPQGINPDAVGFLSVPAGLLDLSDDAGVHKPLSFPRSR
jgi:hypothetical protein